MKNSNQILGLPIISIADGGEVGKVKSLVINPDKGSVDFITIEHEDWQVSVKAIPFKKVIGIGEYAVTVDNENAIIDLNEIPIANQLVNKKIKILNTKMMTRKGELIGEVNEYFLDDNTGDIIGMLLTTKDKQVALSSEAVITFGKDIIIVSEDASGRFLNSPEELDGSSDELGELVELDAENESKAAKQDVMDEIQQVEAPELYDEQEMVALRKKQALLLTGKKLTKDVFDHDGNLLFSAGTVLNNEDVVKAQEAGSGIVVEISMNIEGR
ncbi:PRC-barrel domain-containing protein [Mesobacillus subterraneus]|uniref:PRC-barrel domain-containing protein n=1 Tax=Mesobacillus subterraneus TaxID=285983 RepID=UPI001CFC8BDC|nr:PRC-barrel domain-containing protein [Mesobacillus subterraneus]WLR56182.1 PRC-barrel domain-containing protein [Mesobacillus subterraneus]